MSSKGGTFFERPVGTTFSSILVDFGLHFGRVLGAKIRKKHVSERFAKNVKKKKAASNSKSHASNSKSHAGVYKPGGGSLTSTHLGVPRPPPELRSIGAGTSKAL